MRASWGAGQTLDRVMRDNNTDCRQHLLKPVQDQATKWLWTYNNDRPNMGIGGITPAMKLKLTA